MLNVARFFVCSIFGGFSNEIKTVGRLGRNCTVPHCRRVQEESGGGATTTSAASGQFDGDEYAAQDSALDTANNPRR
jgi:hypothetical protein